MVLTGMRPQVNKVRDIMEVFTDKYFSSATNAISSCISKCRYT